jgi:hypothetical protein
MARSSCSADVCSSHTFPSEGSPNHQSSSRDDWKIADAKSSSGGEGKTVRISPDPPQTCGVSNKCADEDKCNSGNNLKEKTGRRCSYVVNFNHFS